MAMGKQEVVQEFINHHVMRHAGSADVWNLPFVHVNALEWFRYDSVMVFVVGAVLVAVSFAVRRSYGTIPKGIAAVAELYVVFIRDQIVYAQFGAKEGRRFVSFFCTLFLFILTANLLGLIPLFSTATGNVSVTAGLATIFMFTTLGAMLRLRGLHGFKAAFVPQGLPGALVPLMAGMEVIGFVSRTFALTMRLFANMLAGHIVIYSLLSLIVVIGWAAVPSMLIVVAMYFFELFVAVMQAYVFSLLSAIFMNMMVNPEH
ncbi:MAG: F0F1 ATP synthase subunit A [bacterium]